MNDLQLWALRLNSSKDMTFEIISELVLCRRFEKQGGCEFACRIVAYAYR